MEILRNDGKKRDDARRMTATAAGTTVIDLGANPDDLPPAVDHLVTTVQEARAAHQKIILALGEDHSVIANVAMASFVRTGLQRAGIVNPVIALEHVHNLLERFLPDFFPGKTAFQERSRHVLTALKTGDPARYARMQALACGSANWMGAPATRIYNISAWLADDADIRLIDLAITSDGFLDTDDPATAAFIGEHARTTARDRKRIHAIDLEGVRLRNEWMAARLRDILKQADVVILQTGYNHIGGNRNDRRPYAHSLYRAFARAANDNIRFIPVFPENYGLPFRGTVPPEGREAMNNPDTVILRGGNATRHRRGKIGSFAEEIAVLNAFARASRMPENAPRIENINDYNRLLKKNLNTLRRELSA